MNYDIVDITNIIIAVCAITGLLIGMCHIKFDKAKSVILCGSKCLEIERNNSKTVDVV
jgi:hypothetical protein